MNRVTCEYANNFLLKQDVKDFWLEIGYPVKLPDFWEYFYKDGCLVILEPFGENCGIHVASGKSARGKSTVHFCIKVISYAKKKYKRVLARIQKQRKEVVLLSRICGMVQYHEDLQIYYCEAIKCQ